MQDTTVARGKNSNIASESVSKYLVKTLPTYAEIASYLLPTPKAHVTPAY